MKGQILGLRTPMGQSEVARGSLSTPDHGAQVQSDQQRGADWLRAWGIGALRACFAYAKVLISIFVGRMVRYGLCAPSAHATVFHASRNGYDAGKCSTMRRTETTTCAPSLSSLSRSV